MFTRRGERLEGVVVEVYDKDFEFDFVVEVEQDGRVKEVDVRERDNDVKKVVEVKKKKKVLPTCRLPRAPLLIIGPVTGTERVRMRAENAT